MRFSIQVCCVFSPPRKKQTGVKLHLDARRFQRQMVVIFSRVFIGWMERWLWLIEALELVVFTRKIEIRIGNNWSREAGRGEIDFSATISEPLSFTHPLQSWSASPHTPACLRDISCVQRGDKTHCLSASVGQYIHLVPGAALRAVSYCTCKLLFTGRRSLLFLLTGVSSHRELKCAARTERERDIIMVNPSKCCLLPLYSIIQLAETEDVTQEARLHQRTLVLLCWSHNHDALNFTDHVTPGI